MKELSIKQKAKAYDESLERAKKLQETCDSTAVVGWCEYIFPELKESDDEKTRKELVAFLEELSKLGKNTNFDRWKTSDCANWIAWLDMCVAAFKHGVENTLDELHLKQILANSCGTCKDEQESTETVKWSAQEEYCICELEAMVKEAWRKAENVRNGVTIKKMQELMFFLKTLNPNKKPQRIISAEAKEDLYDKPAWSERDEYRYNACLQYFEEIKPDSVYYKDYLWLKSLKERIKQ